MVGRWIIRKYRLREASIKLEQNLKGPKDRQMGYDKLENGLKNIRR